MILLCKALYRAFAVFVQSSLQVVCHAGVQDSISFVGQKVDIILFHILTAFLGVEFAEAFLLSERVLRDCHVGLRPPRNDKPVCFTPPNYYCNTCDCLWRSLSAATDAIGAYHFNGSRYETTVRHRASRTPLPFNASAHKKRRIRFGMRRMGDDIQERSLPRSQVYSQRMESPSCTVQSDAP